MKFSPQNRAWGDLFSLLNWPLKTAKGPFSTDLMSIPPLFGLEDIYYRHFGLGSSMTDSISWPGTGGGVFLGHKKNMPLLGYYIFLQVQASQAGGRSFKGRETTSQSRNLPIECTQCNQPVRCPNRCFCAHHHSAVASGGGVLLVAGCVFWWWFPCCWSFVWFLLVFCRDDIENVEPSPWKHDLFSWNLTWPNHQSCLKGDTFSKPCFVPNIEEAQGLKTHWKKHHAEEPIGYGKMVSPLL